MVAVPISSVVAGPVSGLLLQMDGIAGLSGWKWLFLLEGLPVAVLGLAMLKVLSDRPETATWLSDDERKVVSDRIRGERREKEVRHLGAALKDLRVLILAGVQFGFLVGSYGVGLFLPQIIKLGNLSDLEVGFVSSGCYVVATIGMIVWAGQVDKRGGKVVNLALACLISAVGFVGAIASSNFWVSLTFVTVALTGINAARGIFWTIPPRFLTGMAAAGGLAFINSVGTMGGFVGPYLMGWLTDRTGSFSAGLGAMAGFLLLATGAVVVVEAVREAGLGPREPGYSQSGSTTSEVCEPSVFSCLAEVSDAATDIGFQFRPAGAGRRPVVPAERRRCGDGTSALSRAGCRGEQEVLDRARRGSGAARIDRGRQVSRCPDRADGGAVDRRDQRIGRQSRGVPRAVVREGRRGGLQGAAPGAIPGRRIRSTRRKANASSCSKTPRPI